MSELRRASNALGPSRSRSATELRATGSEPLAPIAGRDPGAREDSAGLAAVAVTRPVDAGSRAAARGGARMQQCWQARR